MREYEKVIVPARTEEVLVRRKCDLCGVEAEKADWDAGVYVVDETEIKIIIKHKEGSCYPEGSWGSEYEIDLCPECFRERLIPWLKGEGANIKEVEW
jgi:hypothetical protein